MRNMILAAVAAVAVATSASAVTTVTSQAGNNAAGQNILFNFNSGTPAGLTGNFSITSGTVAQLAAAPLGDLTPYLVVPGLNQGQSGTATLNLGGAYNNISLYWGSIDTYNNITFYTGLNGTGSVLGATYAGNQIPGATADGAQGSPNSNRRVFFNFGTDTARSVVFNSANIAFELDDIGTSTVPEPTIWATLISGFGLVGFSMRRRRRILSVAA